MDQYTQGLELQPKKSRKKVFLDGMNQLVPWATLVALIAPFARGAHQAIGVPHTVSHRDHRFSSDSHKPGPQGTSAPDSTADAMAEALFGAMRLSDKGVLSVEGDPW